MKHERSIKPEKRQAWRRKKTLARRVDFRPLERDDIRYLWATYKKTGLKSLGGPFLQDTMEVAEFNAAIEREVAENYQGAWCLFAETKRGFMPVGVVLGFYSHPNPRLAPFMIIGDMIWFPWSSARNRVESAVHFFHRIRQDIPMVEYANEDAKRFFEVLAAHGVVRRVGTSFNVYPGVATAVFETGIS